MTEDLTPTSDSDPPPPTEAESPPPLNSSDKDISGSLDVQKQPQQLQQPYLIEDFIPTVFVEQVRNQHFLCHISMHQNISSCFKDWPVKKSHKSMSWPCYDHF